VTLGQPGFREAYKEACWPIPTFPHCDLPTLRPSHTATFPHCDLPTLRPSHTATFLCVNLLESMPTHATAQCKTHRPIGYLPISGVACFAERGSCPSTVLSNGRPAYPMLARMVCRPTARMSLPGWDIGGGLACNRRSTGCVLSWLGGLRDLVCNGKTSELPPQDLWLRQLARSPTVQFYATFLVTARYNASGVL
jgi:hypothetical protein